MLLPGLVGLGLAFSAALVVTALSGLVGRGPSADRGRWGVPLGLGSAYALGHAAIREWLKVEWPPLPPLDAADWVPWLALAATGLGLLEVAAPTPAWARWENRLLLTAATLGLLLAPLFQGTWTPRQGVGWMVGLGLGVLAFWGVLEAQADRLGRGLILPLAMLAGGTSGVLLLAHSLVLAEFSAALAVALGASWLVSRWRPGLTLARGGVPVVAVVLAGLILVGRFYAFPELPVAAAIPLALAPTALWVDRLGPVRRLRPGWVGLVRAIAILVPVGLALAVVALAAPAMGPEGY